MGGTIKHFLVKKNNLKVIVWVYKVFAKQNNADDKVFYGFQRGNSPPPHILLKVCMYLWSFFVICLNSQTRMHSSRMRTARLLTISQHALHRGGCLPGGVSTWGVSAWVRSAQGVSTYQGVSACQTPPPPPCGQNSGHTLVKTLPFRNFVCGR